MAVKRIPATAINAGEPYQDGDLVTGEMVNEVVKVLKDGVNYNKFFIDAMFSGTTEEAIVIGVPKGTLNNVSEDIAELESYVTSAGIGLLDGLKAFIFRCVYGNDNDTAEITGVVALNYYKYNEVIDEWVHQYAVSMDNFIKGLSADFSDYNELTTLDDNDLFVVKDTSASLPKKITKLNLKETLGVNDVNQRVDDIVDGTTIVKKAEQDKNGNDIVATYETKADAASKKLELDERIDNIIVGTIEGASAQEIIDARQGEVTLGANITKIKSQLAYITNIEIILPEKLIAVVGHEFNVYNDNIILCDNLDNYEIRWGNSGGLGMTLNECYRLTPISSNVGTTTLTVGVYRKDTGVLIKSKSTLLKVIPQTVYPNLLDTESLNYVVGTRISGVTVGEVFSTSADANIAYYVLDIASLTGKITISMHDSLTTIAIVVLDSDNKGLRTASTSANIRANAYSWSVYDAVNDCYTIDLGILRSSHPTFAKIGINFYTVDTTNYIRGKTPKVIFIGDSLTDAGYYPAEVVRMGGGAITSLGTRSDTVTIDETEYIVSHEGRVSWSAVNYVNNQSYAGKTNAFWNPSTSKFDFSYYMTQQGYSGVDYVFINLGTNDTSKELAVEAIDEMIASIHAYNTNIKVVISLINPPVGTQDGWGLGKGVNGTRDIYKRKQLGFVKDYILNYENREDNVDVASIYTAIDTMHDYDVITVTVSARNPMQVVRQNDTVHPSVYGYLKFADVYWNYLNH